MKCPLCNGTGKVPSAKVDPQKPREKDICPACMGTMEVEMVDTKKSIIKIVKPHGTYSTPIYS